MIIGDALYRIDQQGWGLRLDYVQIESMQSMSQKFILYAGDTPLIKADIRGSEIDKVRENIARLVTKIYGFTIDNTLLVDGGSVPIAGVSRILNAKVISPN